MMSILATATMLMIAQEKLSNVPDRGGEPFAVE